MTTSEVTSGLELLGAQGQGQIPTACPAPWFSSPRQRTFLAKASQVHDEAKLCLGAF